MKYTMDNFIELPSKINNMSLEELNLQEPNTVGLLCSYLNKEKAEEIASKIATEHVAKSKHGSQVIGVWFEDSTGYWVGKRVLNGKKVSIKTSVRRWIVEEAVIDFCKKNNLQVYK